MTGQRWSVDLPGLLPLSGVVLAVDPLGGVFLAVSGAVSAARRCTGSATPAHGLEGRAVQVALPLFVMSLLLVPVAGGVATFLLCWELMALASLVLVLAEHRHRAAGRRPRAAGTRS